MKIVVLMGGMSAERAVSIESGKAVTSALQDLGHDVIEVDADRNIANILTKINPDLVFMALHGEYGEDGCIQGLLEVLGIRYTHSGVLASAVAMNKLMTKHIMQSIGIKSPKFLTVTREEFLQTPELLPYPYVVKPICSGSSIGVRLVFSHQDYQQIIFDNPIEIEDLMIIEEYIAGQEVQTAILLQEPIGTIEIRPKKSFYDYEVKYTDGLADHIFPASIPSEIYDKSLKQASKLHKFLGCRTISRCDFIYNSDEDELYMLEINTHPGLTKLSLVPEIAHRSLGLSFKELIQIIIEDAISIVKSP